MKISNLEVIPKKGKRRGLLLFQILFVFILLAAVWFSFGQNVLAPQNSGIPERWQRLELIITTEGDEALSSVNRLHGTEINMVSAYIAEYASGNEWATAWVGGTESAEAATKLLTMMTDAIARGGAGFSNLQQVTIAGHDVFRIDGPGGKHIFYISGKQPDKVVWLTVNAVDVLPILETGIKIF